jgi:hypothetical protein
MLFKGESEAYSKKPQKDCADVSMTITCIFFKPLSVSAKMQISADQLKKCRATHGRISVYDAVSWVFNCSRRNARRRVMTDFGMENFTYVKFPGSFAPTPVASFPTILVVLGRLQGASSVRQKGTRIQMALVPVMIYPNWFK